MFADWSDWVEFFTKFVENGPTRLPGKSWRAAPIKENIIYEQGK